MLQCTRCGQAIRVVGASAFSNDQTSEGVTRRSPPRPARSSCARLHVDRRNAAQPSVPNSTVYLDRVVDRGGALLVAHRLQAEASSPAGCRPAVRRAVAVDAHAARARLTTADRASQNTAHTRCQSTRGAAGRTDHDAAILASGESVRRGAGRRPGRGGRTAAASVREEVGFDFPPALGDAGDVRANALILRAPACGAAR